MKTSLRAKHKPGEPGYTWLCGGNPAQPNFDRYKQSRLAIGGFRTNTKEPVSTDCLVNHLMRRIEDLEACLWQVGGFCRCSACGVAMNHKQEIRFNNNQHYCPDCALRLIWEYESDEGLPDAMINDLADAPFTSGFLEGAPNNAAWPCHAYWAEIVKACPEVGARYISKRIRRTQ